MTNELLGVVAYIQSRARRANKSGIDMEQLQQFVANHLILVAAFVIILSLLLSSMWAGVAAGGKQISPSAAVKLINQEDAVVIDLREPSEFERGHILDAVNVPYTRLGERIEELHPFKERPVILCCASGSSSARASADLRRAGFGRLFRLKGGIMSWHNDNLPTTR